MFIRSRNTKKIAFRQGEVREESRWAFVSLILQEGKSSLHLAHEDNICLLW